MARILLKFPDKKVYEPVTSQVILDARAPINILSANVTPRGGEILAEVNAADADRIVASFRKRGVTVSVQRKIEVDRDRCIDCGSCYSLCPVDAISFETDRAVAFDTEKCVACGLCVDTCPMRAIHL
ncbi:4Fe-4S binding protein [Candidatus Bathyarchaeota archaeon]|jgi:NAD-dependent dihydropyrimidine dehydrogenase PreA subunit|nr:4Fe-4S binding protein [Candidatus Bathyarchaeota archaeon]